MYCLYPVCILLVLCAVSVKIHRTSKRNTRLFYVLDTELSQTVYKFGIAYLHRLVRVAVLLNGPILLELFSDSPVCYCDF